MCAVSVPGSRRLCDDAAMLELWQAEWCSYPHRVRLRLTGLRLDRVARAIPLDRAERAATETATGTRSIPTLVDGDTTVHGADAIIAYLDERHAEPDDAGGHRAQMRVEWPHRLELEGGGQVP
jgi:glutathione S-transferase